MEGKTESTRCWLLGGTKDTNSASATWARPAIYFLSAFIFRRPFFNFFFGPSCRLEGSSWPPTSTIMSRTAARVEQELSIAGSEGESLAPEPNSPKGAPAPSHSRPRPPAAVHLFAGG